MNETSGNIDVQNRTQKKSLRAVCHDLDTNNERTGKLFIAGRGRNLDELLRSLYNREIDEGQPERLTEFTIQEWQGERWEEVDINL